MKIKFDPIGLLRFDFTKRDGTPYQDSPKATLLKYAILFPIVAPLPVVICFDGCGIFVTFFPGIHGILPMLLSGNNSWLLLWVWLAGLCYVISRVLHDAKPNITPWKISLLVICALTFLTDMLFLMFESSFARLMLG